MCEVCAIFGAGEHWSDFARMRNQRYPFEDILHYRQERIRRIGILNAVLNRHGMTCDDWDGETLAVHHKSGRFKLAPTLNDVWKVAEDLSGLRLSPLGESFGRGEQRQLNQRQA